MIAFVNPTNKPVKVQYISGSKTFRKEILPNSITAMKSLSNILQLKNQTILVRQGIGIYNYNNSTFINNPGANFSFGYDGAAGETGMTMYVSNKSVPTGWTFVTSANTVMANNTVSATTVGNDIYVGFSGAAVSTLAWYNAIGASYFSNHGITVQGTSSTSYITSAGTETFVLSADTYSTTIDKFVFVGNNVKPGEYQTLGTMNFATGMAFLSSRV